MERSTMWQRAASPYTEMDLASVEHESHTHFLENHLTSFLFCSSSVQNIHLCATCNIYEQ